MTLHRYRIFATIAKHQNVSRASQELHISQPSVSQQLRILEGELGMMLIQKNGRGIGVTPEGRKVLEKIQPILLENEKFEKNLKDGLLNQTSESLTIGGSYAPSFVLLPSVMALFQKSHPSVMLSLRTGNSGDIEKLLIESEIEIALVANPFHSPALHIEPYRQDKFLAFVSKNHPLAKKKSLSADDFSRTSLLIRTARGRRSIAENILSRLESKGFRPNISMRCESPHAVKTAVQKGAGMGILYEDVLRDDIRRGNFKVLKFEGIDLSSTSYLLYPKDRPLSPHALRFLALLRQERDKNRRSRRAIPAAGNSPFPTRSAADLPPP